jgi:hypothetical protein
MMTIVYCISLINDTLFYVVDSIFDALDNIKLIAPFLILHQQVEFELSITKTVF